MDTIAEARKLTRSNGSLGAVIVAAMLCLPIWFLGGDSGLNEVVWLLILAVLSVGVTLWVLARGGYIRSGQFVVARRLAIGVSWRVVLLGSAIGEIGFVMLSERVEVTFDVSFFFLMGVALSLIPVAFLAQLVAAIVVKVFDRHDPESDPDAVSEVEAVKASSKKLTVVAVLLVLAGFLSPSIGFLPEPKEEGDDLTVESKDPVADDSEEPQPQVSGINSPLQPPPDQPKKPPPFVKPSGLERADPTQFIFGRRHELTEVSSRPIGAFAPNSKLLAYSLIRGRSVRVLDTDSFEEVDDFNIGSSLRHICWSPDSKRLFFVSDSGAGVVDIESSSIARLPVDALPSSKPNWWNTDEVAFAPTGIGSPTVLNLESLKLESAAGGERWNSLPAPVVDRWRKTGILSEPRKNLRTSLSVEGLPVSYRLPSRTGRSIQEELRFALVLQDRNHFFDRGFVGMKAEDGSVILTAPDSSRCAILSPRGGEVHYFAIEEKRERRFAIDLPGATDSMKRAAEAGALFAYVCGPQINPLNKETIGANRKQLNGKLLITEIEGGQAVGFVSTELFPILKGHVHVVCDLHASVEGDNLILLTSDDWWSVLTESKETPDSKREPSRQKVEGVRVSEEDLREDVETAVGRFIRAHHAASGDTRVFMSGFVDRVDYYSQGFVSIEQIERDHVAYRKKFSKMNEWVDGQVNVKRKVNGTFQAVYRLEIDHTKLDAGRPENYRGWVELETTVLAANGTMKIVKIRELKRSLK